MTDPDLEDIGIINANATSDDLVNAFSHEDNTLIKYVMLRIINESNANPDFANLNNPSVLNAFAYVYPRVDFRTAASKTNSFADAARAYCRKHDVSVKPSPPRPSPDNSSAAQHPGTLASASPDAATIIKNAVRDELMKQFAAFGFK